MKLPSKTKHSARGKSVSAPKTKTAPAVAVIPALSASNLQNVLWATMHDLKENNITPNRADAIASQAREILRTVNTQLRIASAGRRGVPDSIVKFSED